jgi:hypothetical protein
LAAAVELAVQKLNSLSSSCNMCATSTGTPPLLLLQYLLLLLLLHVLLLLLLQLLLTVPKADCESTQQPANIYADANTQQPCQVAEYSAA